MPYKQPSTKYQTLPRIAEDSDTEELLSSTEVDVESVPGDEKKWRSADGDTKKHSRIRTYVARFRHYRWLIDTFLLLVNIALSLLLMRRFWTENASGGIQDGGDFTGAGPECVQYYVR